MPRPQLPTKKQLQMLLRLGPAERYDMLQIRWVHDLVAARARYVRTLGEQPLPVVSAMMAMSEFREGKFDSKTYKFPGRPLMWLTGTCDWEEIDDDRV